MRIHLTDSFLILILISLPLFGIMQACGGDGPTTPDPPDNGEPPPDNHPPVAVLLVVGPADGPTPFTVHLDGSDSYDPDDDPLDYLWLFSDEGQATGSVATHEFASSGRYSAELIVTDKWGLSDHAGPVTLYGWGLANSPWPKFAHDERNSGVSPNVGPMMDLEHADEGGAFPRYWRSGVENDKVNAVCIGYDGMVIYTQGPWLRARTADGGYLWDVEAESEITAWPAIMHDGSIVLGTEAGWVHRVDSEGKMVWSASASEAIQQPVVLFSAVNIDGNGMIYLGGHDDVDHPMKGWLISLAYDGELAWVAEVEGYFVEYDGFRTLGGRLVPALTPDGDIVINGTRGQRLGTDGHYITSFEYDYHPDAPQLSQALGPPSVNEEGNIVFTHPQAPLFLPNGRLYMLLMDPEDLDPWYYSDQFAWVDQAPVWGLDGVSIVHAVDFPKSPFYLSTRTYRGDYHQYHLLDTPDGLKNGFEPASVIAGASEDSRGTLYISCLGLRAISPIEYQTVFPYEPRRYSLWTYERPSSHMTAPAIGEDGWLYIGYGNDIMAIGD